MAAQTAAQSGHGDAEALGLVELVGEDEDVMDGEAEGEGVVDGDVDGVGVQKEAQAG